MRSDFASLSLMFASVLEVEVITRQFGTVWLEDALILVKEYEVKRKVGSRRRVLGAYSTSNQFGVMIVACGSSSLYIGTTSGAT